MRILLQQEPQWKYRVHATECHGTDTFSRTNPFCNVGVCCVYQKPFIAQNLAVIHQCTSDSISSQDRHVGVINYRKFFVCFYGSFYNVVNVWTI